MGMRKELWSKGWGRDGGQPCVDGNDDDDDDGVEIVT